MINITRTPFRLLNLLIALLLAVIPLAAVVAAPGSTPTRTISDLYQLEKLTNTELSGFLPNVTTSLQYEDNVRRAPEPFAQNDTRLALRPDLPLLWNFGTHKAGLSYEGEYAQYAQESELNYNDHAINSVALFDHSSRLKTALEFGHNRGHNIPDDNNVAANLTSALDRWKENHAAALVGYGSRASQGQLVSKVSYQERNYLNNSQLFLDAEKSGLSSIFYYRLAPKTRIPFEISVDHYDYKKIDDPTFSLNNNEYKYLTGISWEATAKSTGIFQVGLLDKRYDNPLFDSTSVLMFRLDSILKPNSYTAIKFGALRDTQESLQALSKAYIQNHLRAEVSHKATPLTTLLLGTLYTAAETDDAQPIREKRYHLRLEVRYSLATWLEVAAAYRHAVRNSDIDSLDYKTNLFMVSAETKLGVSPP